MIKGVIHIIRRKIVVWVLVPSDRSGVEFDYSTVHAVKTIQEMGYEAIIINNNPETVSTDPTVGNKLHLSR